MGKILWTGLLAAVSCWGAPQPLTKETIWDWRTVSSPRIDPQGRRVVYVLQWADRVKDAFYSNLWIVSADGTGNRPVTQGDYRDTAPAWSPDGKRLAYLSNRGGKSQIHVRWMESGEEAQITNAPEAPADIAWSPDGASIAYIARVPQKPDWSADVPQPPKGAQWADPPQLVTRLRWRADGIAGAGLIASGNLHLFVVPATGGAPRQISSGNFDHTGRPAWTPDGRRLVVTASRIPDADHVIGSEDLFAFSVEDRTVTRLSRARGPERSPVISPDGRRIAFLGYLDREQSHHTTHLWVMNADGSGARALTGKLDRNISSPVWKTDGSGLYAVVEDRGESHISLVGLDGSSRPLTSGRWRFGTAYASSDEFTAGGERIAVTMSGPSHPADIVAFTAARPETITRLTAANASLLADRRLGAVEEILYKSFDGREIQGWLIQPPGFDPARKYPLILDIHGGPHAMYGVEFNHQMQIFAGAGYLVLYTNPRGSTGYGEEFGNVIHARYPGDDYKDLMAGVDAVLAKGYADPARLTVTGGSGGGLLTAWTVTQTDRFAAAVSQYPVTNWFTQTGSADIGIVMARWMKAMPWENPQQYIERSPVFYAGKVKTPTMVLTGEEDWRTPIGQSEEFYFALKARKVDTALVRFPNEPHGIRGRYPSHRIGKIAYILGWFDKYTRTERRD